MGMINKNKKKNSMGRGGGGSGFLVFSNQFLFIDVYDIVGVW